MPARAGPQRRGKEKRKLDGGAFHRRRRPIWRREKRTVYPTCAHDALGAAARNSATDRDPALSPRTDFMLTGPETFAAVLRVAAPAHRNVGDPGTHLAPFDDGSSGSGGSARR
jgi:hypothetical protein